MTEPEIHDALHRIVPDDLSASGLAAGAHRKRRNRSRAVAGVSALALVALAIPVALNLPNSARPTVANPAESSTQHSDTSGQTPAVPTPQPADVPTGPQMCARYAAELTPKENPGDLPANPTRAWLCGDAVDGPGGGHGGPLEPLTTDVAKVVDGFNALEKVDITTMMCTAEYVLTYRVVLEYDGGAPRQVTGELHGCRTVNDGQTFRAGGAAFLDQMVKLWQAQRAAGGPSYAGAVANCPVPSSLIPVKLADTTGGMVCRSDANAPGSTSIGSLPPDLFQTVKAGLASAKPADLPPLDQSGLSLGLTNGFGDALGVVLYADKTFYFADGQTCADATADQPATCTPDTKAWKPSPEMLRQLEDLMMVPAPGTTDPSAAPTSGVEPGKPGTGQTTDPATPTPELPADAAGCTGASTGDLKSTDLPDGKLPDGATRVWLCAQGPELLSALGPWEPLDLTSTSGDQALVVDAVVAFNGLKAADPNQACTMELGPSYLVVYEYPGGKRYVVEEQLYGCRTVTAGGRTLAGATDFHSQLVKLWESQRAVTDPKPGRPLPPCQELSSVFTVNAKSADFLSGVACLGAGDGTAKAVELAPELVTAIEAGLKSATPMGQGRPGWTENSIVLLTTHGDPVTLRRLIDGSYMFTAGTDQNWTPTGSTADQLKAIFG